MVSKEITGKARKPTKKDGEVKSFIKGCGFCSAGIEANVLVVDVKDSRLVRFRPLHYDWKYDPKEFNPWKFETHGKVFEPSMKSLIPPLSLAYKKRVYSPNRLLYPLKRVDFDPVGDRHPDNRGKSGYVRISWDEATDIIAGEIRRIVDKYGSYAIFCQMDGHGETKCLHGPHGTMRRLLNLLGGFTEQFRNTDSWEGWYWGGKHVWGMEPVGQQGPVTNVMLDISESTRLLLHWGCDAETTPWGWSGQLASRLCYWFSGLGIRQVFVCPDLNYSAAVHADKWIPILPNTDVALQLAIAYIWITEGTYDKDYLATHSVGFEKFRDYVLGKGDGIAKTPTWAAEKCRVSTRIIKALAREWASRPTTIAHGNGGPGIRGPYSTEPARTEIVLLAMQGLGKPGANQVKMIEWSLFDNEEQQPLPRGKVLPHTHAADRSAMAITKTEDGLFKLLDPLSKQFIPKDLVHDAILHPPISWYGTGHLTFPVEDQFVKYEYPAKGCSEIHMIWTDSPCMVTCWNDGNRILEAYRSPKIDFMLAQHPWFENDCLFADIVLPANTKFEEGDINVDVFSGQYNVIFPEPKCIEPLGESHSDYEITCLIAEKLGMLKEFTKGKTVEDCIKAGFEHSGVHDMISWEELKGKGYFVVPTDPKWKEYPHGLIQFYEDPDNHPLRTPSGKLEIYSQRLAEHFPDDNERPPFPKWIEKGPSHDERLSSQRARTYPLLVLSNHPRWGVHANHDDVTWFREIETCKVKGSDGYLYHPLWLNPRDAAARGIQNGDVVKIYNERGAVLCGAYVTERVMPGAVSTDHGAKYDPIVPGELDRGGAINTITPHQVTSKNATGMAVSGFLVEVERVDLDELTRKYPEAFKRSFDLAAGPIVDSFLYRGE